MIAFKCKTFRVCIHCYIKVNAKKGLLLSAFLYVLYERLLTIVMT